MGGTVAIQSVNKKIPESYSSQLNNAMKLWEFMSFE